MGRHHTEQEPLAKPQGVRQSLPEPAAYQADGGRPQRDERVDGVARQDTADHIRQRTHGKTCPGPEHDARQQHGQAAQVEPDKAR